MSTYGAAALDRECADVAATIADRNTRLYAAAVAIGQLVGAGEIDRHDAERRLFAAAEACAYLRTDGEKAAKATIKSGLDRGKLKPRERRCADKGETRQPTPIAQRPIDEAERERGKAQWLWRQRRPVVEGSPAWRYLREARGYGGLIPATLGFLPASGAYPPALIAAFGICLEPEPGEIGIADNAVGAVQIIRLTGDGSSKAPEPPAAKIIVGRGALGLPIIVAPPNDLLGLAVCEGIEDALSIYAATGLGAWASGGAGRMPALAATVPAYIDFVTICADRDASGVNGANGLAERLRERGIPHTISFLDSGHVAR